MILILISEEHTKTVFLKQGWNTVSKDTVFYRTRNRVLLKETSKVHRLSKEELHIGTSFRMEEQGRQYRGYLCENESGFRSYRYYEPVSEMTIGNAIEDTIYIGNQNLKAKIYWKGTHIEELGEPSVLCVNGKRGTCFDLLFGDCVEILNCRIVYGKSFLMINQCSNVFTDLKEQEIVKSFGPLPKKLDVQNQVGTYHPKVEPLTVELLEPLPLMRRNQNPLIFSIGPTLTMASASLLSGYLSFSNGLNNGRAVRQLLPVLILPMVMLVSALLWNPLQRRYEKKLVIKENEKRLTQYQVYLASVNEECKNFVLSWRKDLEQRYPMAPGINPGTQPPVLRLGTYSCAIPITFQRRFRLTADDPIQTHLYELTSSFRVADGIPFVVSLNAGLQIHIQGASEQELQSIFYRLFHTATVNTVIAGVFLSKKQIKAYSWLRFIPHLQFEDRRWLLTENAEVQEFLEHSAVVNQTILLIDFTGKLKIDERKERVVFLRISDAQADQSDRIRIDLKGGIYETDTERFSFRKDQFTDDDPFVFYEGMISSAIRIRNDSSVASLFEVPCIDQIPLEDNWQNRLCKDSLKAPIGWDRNGEILCMDLSESGMGPHGLIAGTTGSGKSAWIVMLILSLACLYSPRELQFAILDFKGGGASSSLFSNGYQLPHLAGTLTNLEPEDMQRALTSFQNECRKRESLFQKMKEVCGHTVRELHEYQTAWHADSKLPYLPELILIIDEFAELKSSHPEYIRELVSLARTGRSLGIHMILATQKPAGVIDEQIWSNTGFKVSLKVQSRQDSMEILHEPDAAMLRHPGEFCLLHNGILEKGNCAYPYQSVHDEESRIHQLDEQLHVVNTQEQNGPSQIEALLNRMQQIQPEPCSYQLWLPMLKTMRYPEYGSAMEFGILDDYERGIQPALRLKSEERLLCVFTLDRYEKKQFLLAMIFGILKSKEPLELLILDFLDLGLEFLREDGRLIDLLNDHDEEKIDNVLKYLKQRHDHQIIVLLTDTFSVYGINDRYRTKFHELYEHADRYHLNFVLFGTSSDSIPYRDLSLADARIALKNENRQELSAIFETAVKRVVKRKNAFLYRRNRLIQGLYYSVDPNDFEAVFDRAYVAYRIPHMPSVLKAVQYQGKGIAIGMTYENYDWITVLAYETVTIVILGDGDRKRFEKLGITARYVNVQDLNRETNEMDRRVLLSQEAYRIQLRYRLFEEVHFEKNDALLFENEEGRRIRLVE